MFRCATTYIMMYRCSTQGHDLQADVPRGGLRRQFAVPVLRRHVEVSHCLKKCIKHMKHRNKYLSEIIKRHNICKNELMKAHDPHTWYGKNGKELWIDDLP